MWVAADQGASVVRVSPASNRVVARIEAGDGPASMAFDGATAWVVNHRDTTINRIDLGTNESTLFTTLGGVNDRAPERMTFSHGSLWVTGRGTDLLKVNPATGVGRPDDRDRRERDRPGGRRRRDLGTDAQRRGRPEWLPDDGLR